MVVFIGGAAAAAISVTYISTSSVAPSSATHTHSSLTLGGTSADFIVVAAAINGANTNTISSVTIDGVSATEAVSLANGEVDCGIWVAQATGDATGDIVLTMTGTKPRSIIAWWRMTGASGVAASATASDSTSTYDLDINLPANGALFAVGAARNTPTAVTIAAGPTRDAHAIVNDLRIGAGAMTSVAAVTPQDVQITFTGGSEPTTCSAAFAP